MRLLAIETATATGGVALLEGGRLVEEISDHVPRRHLEWLAPAIRRILDHAGWTPASVAGVGVSVGPGSFTGLRIGIATAAAWARARGVPVVGVPTLAVLAAGVTASGLICPALDARRGEVAAGLFRSDGGVPIRVTEDFVGSVEAALDRLPPGEPVVFAGDALNRYQEVILSRRGALATLAPPEQWAPRAAMVGRLAWLRLSRGDGDDPYLLHPVYARPPAVDAPAAAPDRERKQRLASENNQ